MKINLILACLVLKSRTKIEATLKTSRSDLCSDFQQAWPSLKMFFLICVICVIFLQNLRSNIHQPNTNKAVQETHLLAFSYYMARRRFV